MSKSKSLWTSVAGVVTSILAFLGIVSCCGMPIIAGILSLLGIGASQLSFFAEYRWWFVTLSVICIAWGFFQVYGKKKTDCCSCDDGKTDNNIKATKQVAAKIILWIGLLLTAFIVAYNLLQTEQPTSCCPSVTKKQTQSEFCGSSSEESEIEFENHSSAPTCCNSEESPNTSNDSNANN